ncbi:M48 family metalloprotease [Streptomyces sp. NBC_00576]|uniref:M48 family metalloprotease n=1 Tax=Streptomyces sp. NBC_00576 TaxID=2903665 RepID=UPI002E7FFD35|nr:M48 family metalloprotease [Streptomyces sp. NBC_00576]WUB73947.1 M48 family metalloprotease [Streptomyces sp. NBC_00576]
MTHPPSSRPEYPEPSEQPLFPPTYPEQPAPTYPQTAQAPQQPPQHQNPAQPPSYPASTQPPAHPGSPQPPSSPDAAKPPSYPDTARSPAYPSATEPSQYPDAAKPPSYPDPAQPPSYPDSAQPPSYPDPAQQPQYPGFAEPPAYPGSPQHSRHPDAPQPPAQPGSPQQPQHPNAAQPPTYPGAPQQPQAYQGATPTPPQAPTYPGTDPTQPPPYPQAATAQAVPPQYAPPQQPPSTPAPPDQGFTPPTAPEAPPAPPAEHPHHISTDRGRVHISAHQRRTDATAVGNLLLYLPNFLCSLLVVSMFSLFFGDLAFLVIIAWILSGALVFHRPTESALARRLLHLRYPTPQERAKLEPVWREVTARAGVEGRNYELWVEDSDGLNAVAAAGHIVGVTRFAMNELPNGELAAVMAHELGHHVGGHAWSGLLGYWYAQPGRLAWRFLRAFSVFVFKVSRAFSCFGVGFVVLVLGGIAMATISTLYGLPLLILGVPYALAAVGRRAELRADEHAAALGFAPMLASVLDKLHQEEQRQTAALAALNNGVAPQESPLSKLLSSHPDHHTRLHHLQPYLQQQQR